jgi:hypothetical protein
MPATEYFVLTIDVIEWFLLENGWFMSASIFFCWFMLAITWFTVANVGHN